MSDDLMTLADTRQVLRLLRELAAVADELRTAVEPELVALPRHVTEIADRLRAKIGAAEEIVAMHQAEARARWLAIEAERTPVCRMEAVAPALSLLGEASEDAENRCRLGVSVATFRRRVAETADEIVEQLLASLDQGRKTGTR